MAKIELNYMLGDEVWFLFPIFDGNILKGHTPCKGVVQDIEITLMGSSFVKYLVRYKILYSVCLQQTETLYWRR